ncbi:MAG TPA: transcription antitermination factor NusB [Cyanobacteria bacterium UBA11049]|nr:transcription antitermination factor NusB [Cyanobacteria bacterium UBA11049]
MQQPRRIARELALLSLSQLPNSPEKLQERQLSDLLLAALRTLKSEMQESLETAASELQRASDRLLTSETRAADVQTSRSMVEEAIALTQTAINRVATVQELPEMIQLADRPEFDVRRYALQIVSTVNKYRNEIDKILEQALVDWQLNRLARIDRDILRIAVAEIEYLGFKDSVSVAINEAVELAKRYSEEEGYKFINGVLRRVTEQKKAGTPQVKK